MTNITKRRKNSRMKKGKWRVDVIFANFSLEKLIWEKTKVDEGYKEVVKRS